MLLGYVGPETMLPIASLLAAAAGAIMMVGRRVRLALVAAACRCFGITRRRDSAS